MNALHCTSSCIYGECSGHAPAAPGILPEVHVHLPWPKTTSFKSCNVANVELG